jgi:hypothetical protein
MEGVKDSGGVVALDGDVDRVDGALTAMESAVEAVVDNEVVDTDPIPVRRAEAARRGRLVADVVAVLADVVSFALCELAFMLILAASWFSDGIRAPSGGRNGRGCEASTGPVAAGGGVVVIVVRNKKLKRLWRAAVESARLFYRFQHSDITLSMIFPLIISLL